MSTSPLRIAGVPEAFNDPWGTADFEKLNLQCAPEFIFHPGGSGAMLSSLESGAVDAAFALTDCIVAAIENGRPFRLLGALVTSPLTWAVIVSPNSGISNVSDLCNATWGVSRYGSGSHVMVQVLGKEQGWSDEAKFKICGNFTGLRNALQTGEVDAFLWEKFTTKPFQENGEVRIVGGIPTPWGCFSVVVRENEVRLKDIRDVVAVFLENGARLKKNGEDAVSGIMKRYGMTRQDGQEWLEGVRYAEVGQTVDHEELELTRKVLKEAGVIAEFRYSGGVEEYHV